MRLRAQSRTVSAAGRGFHPNSASALAVVWRFFRPSPGMIPLSSGLATAIARTTVLGRFRVGHLARVVAEVGAQHAGDVVHPHELARREEALARGGR